MADILIRGIDFPQCCGDCPFQASRWTGDFCSAGQFMFGIDFDYRDKHPKCPLVPLPEGHGRLGDLDALEAKLRKEALQHTCIGDLNRMTLGVGEVIDRIRIADAIVPAEGGNADGN